MMTKTSNGKHRVTGNLVAREPRGGGDCAAAGFFRRAAHLLSVLTIALTIALLISSSPARANGVPFQSGDVLANVGGGFIRHFNSTGTLLDTLNTTTGTSEGDGMCFDALGNLYATEGFGANTVSKFDTNGNLVAANFGSGYNQDPESCVVDGANNVYVGQADGSRNVLEFDATGTPLNTFAPATESRGTDWVDLAADQCTLFYTSEGVKIKRFNVCTNTQLTDFNVAALPGSNAYGHRIRPNGEVLVADTQMIVRLDSSGNQIQTYTLPGTTLLFAINLDPDNTTFWTADYFNGTVFRIDIATGTIVTSFSAGAVSPLGGLAIVKELTVAQPTSTPSGSTPTPNDATVTPTPTATATPGLPGCGNGTVEPPETCDPPDSVAGPCGQLCRSDCTFCGDSVVQSGNGEQCDDGNCAECDPVHPQKALDGCSNTCEGILSCKDPARVTLTTGLDVLKFHGRMVPIEGGPIDFRDNEFSFSLTTAHNLVFEASVPAGAIKALVSSGNFTYRNAAAKQGGGIYKLRAILTRNGTYRVSVTSYGDLSGATADMVTHANLGSQAWTVHGLWSQTGTGWLFDGSHLLQ